MMPVISELLQDTRHTARQWARRPWHTGFAIVALAIGIGANTGVFSVVNALLLRSLPFRTPERLVSLTNFYMGPRDSAAHFHAWRKQSDYLADAALTEQRDVNLGGAGSFLRAHVSQVSGNFFSMLGTRLTAGHGFTEDDDVDAGGWGLPGRNAVAVIGYGLWQQLYGGELRALGSTIRVDGHALAIVGIAPPGFDYPNKTVVWKPGAFSRGNNGWDVIGQLKAGLSLEQARAAFVVDAERLSPDRRKRDPENRYAPTMSPLRDQLAGASKRASLVLMAAVALILLISCTNVANLSVARTADRKAEFAIRSAMGASRARLSRQLLTECVLLSLAALIVGLVVAVATTSMAAKLQPAPLTTQGYSILDVRVLAFALAVSVASGLFFGILPSWFAGRVHEFGARGSSEGRRSRMVRDSLVAAQVMLTIVLLAGSISVGRAFLRIMSADRGFDRKGLITVNVSLDGTTYESAEARLGYFQRALDKMRRLPGIRSASETEFLPLYSTQFMGGPFGLDGRRARQNAAMIPMMPDYVKTMGGRVLFGREFSDAEVESDARVAMVSENFASEFGPPAEAVGRQLTIGNSTPRKVVGVVKVMDYMNEGANSTEVFVPAHSPGGFFSTLVARVDGPIGGRVAMVRDAVQSMDRQVPVFGAKTMEERMNENFARPQFYRTAVFCFAAFALVLAVIGIYGIVSYTVTRRSHEMGVRMVLGTTSGRLRATVLRQGLIPIVAGAAPGVAGAIASGRLLESLVEGAKSVDAATYAATVVFLGAVAAVGIWLATRPIARLDILEILRAE